jgi:hypothetical protein
MEMAPRRRHTASALVGAEQAGARGGQRHCYTCGRCFQLPCRQRWHTTCGSVAAPVPAGMVRRSAARLQWQALQRSGQVRLPEPQHQRVAAATAALRRHSRLAAVARPPPAAAAAGAGRTATAAARLAQAALRRWHKRPACWRSPHKSVRAMAPATAAVVAIARPLGPSVVAVAALVLVAPVASPVACASCPRAAALQVELAPAPPASAPSWTQPSTLLQRQAADTPCMYHFAAAAAAANAPTRC